MDQIRIEALEIDCIVGLRPRERRRRQPVRIDLTLDLDLSAAGETGRITHTADYSRVADSVTQLLRFREYRLIETATEELCAMLLGLHSTVERVSTTIVKPMALQGRAQSASVHVARDRSRFPRRRSSNDWGQHELLLETNEAALSLLHIDARKSLQNAVPSGSRRLEWLTVGQLRADDQTLALDEPCVLNAGEVRYTNPNDERATLFCCLLNELPG